ncbi:unnamed protein product [Rotaria sordida]|uniref:Uncharacterized protein n=1 Tax=Rotaria sordida TaxID=392033 RepID=A0A816ER41_9BILA|nr:unnamed protein product [Rotaria sordida]CAF1652864.1 unnamed protein product [Rotaria sordida]
MSYLLKRMRDERNSKVTNESSAHVIQPQSIPHEHIIHEQKPLLKNIIALKDTHKQRQQTIINTPIHKRNKPSQFHFDRLKQKNNILVIDPFNKQSYIRRRKPFKRFFRQEDNDRQQFNNAAYCVAYCTIIIIGKKIKGITMGGWIGGLFELISSGHNGCNNEHRGHLKCRAKYTSLNVTTHCINIFYKNSILHNYPFICLCRFLNNSQGKYRDCEFLHANIQYI